MPYIGPVGFAGGVITGEEVEDLSEEVEIIGDVTPSVVVIISVVMWPFKTVASGTTHMVRDLNV